MKLIYLLLLVLIVGCASSKTVNVGIENVEDIKDAEEIDSVVSDVEKTIDTNEDKAIIVREDGVEITLESIEGKFVGNNRLIFYNFHGRDLLGRKQNSLNWAAYIYITKDQLVEIPLCSTDELNGNEWRSSHCIEKNIYDSYGSDISIIYTDRPLEDLRRLSDVKIANLDDTFLFNYTKVGL